jgi:hypothetical protein
MNAPTSTIWFSCCADTIKDHTGSHRQSGQASVSLGSCSLRDGWARLLTQCLLRNCKVLGSNLVVQRWRVSVYVGTLVRYATCRL